jgi:5-methylcytosine-specific restriction protein A
MALGDLDDRQAVVAALDEAATIGREPFLAKCRFGKATRYMVRWGGELFDSKAIAAAAHGYQFGRPLDRDELSGGVDHAAGVLRRLGFDIVDTRQTVEPATALVESSELEEGSVTPGKIWRTGSGLRRAG